MALFRVISGELIPEYEFAANAAEIIERQAAASSRPFVAAGPEAVGLAPASAPAASAAETGFEPIAFGQPITIDVRYVWSGRVGAKDSILGGTGDIAVISGVKDWGAFKASARALNWVSVNKGKRTGLTGPGALEDGTRIIAYQKAVATRQLTVTVELAAGPSDHNAVDQLAKLFKGAAGVPIMLPYQGVLLAAGELLPAFSKLLTSITGGDATWSQSAELNFGIAGTTAADAGYRVIASTSAPFGGMSFKEGQGLVDAAGRPYQGDEPYVVIAVDGRADSELENFTPAVVSAELVRRFRIAQEGGGLIDDLLELTQSISDVKFREDAMKVKAKFQGATGKELEDLQKRYDALVKNIQTPELKPN